MNQVFLIGNLSRDPEHRQTTGGISTCSFTLAVEREQSRKDRESGAKQAADFITIITWRNTADLCARYLAKGRQVAVIGKWRNREYEKDGQKRYISECVADEVQFLGPPPRNKGMDEERYADDMGYAASPGH